MKKFILRAAFVLVITTTIAAQADESPDTGGAGRELKTLVEKLGDNSFEIRERAAAELIRHGLEARDALMSGLDHADLEIRLRADQLLVAIAQTDLNRRLSAFLDDVDGKQDHNLPGWKKFENLIGNDRDSRTYFAQMIRSETPLLQAYEAGASHASPALVERIQSLQSNAIPGVAQEIKAQSLATVLLVGADSDVKLDTSVGYQFYNLLNQTHAQKAFTTDAGSPIARKLLTEFLHGQQGNSLMARNGLLLTLRFKMNDVGLELARKIVSGKSVSNSTLPYALLTIGRFGGKDDRATIEPFLDNKTVCHTWHNGKFKDVIKIQIRDVALTVMVHISGQDHKDYGFELLRKSTITLYEVYTCGFAEDEKREAAFAKWQTWLENEKTG